MAWGQQQIIGEIYRQAAKTGADPKLMIADARVESGLNPNAIGDSGSSFGLWQNHVHGAGGPTLQSARQYLDPRVAIANAARRFAGARTVQDVFNVQRPADRASYIAKLQQALRTNSSALNAPLEGRAPIQAGNAVGSVTGTLSPIQQSLIGGMFQGSPLLRGLLAQKLLGHAQPAPVAIPRATPSPTAGSWQALQHIAQQRFGLRNDPGNSQTTGGHHTQGSEHYSGRAIDFGTARNTPEQLGAWLHWARANGYDAINEGTHIHVSLPGSGI